MIKNNVGLADVSNLTKEIWTEMINTAIKFSTEVCLSYENFVSKDFANRMITNFR